MTPITDEQLQALKNSIVNDAMLIGYAVAACLGHKNDELSKKQAYSEYGKDWIDSRTQSKLLKCARYGTKSNSAIKYSRFEIEALKRAEKGLQESYVNAIDKYEKMKQSNKY